MQTSGKTCREIANAHTVVIVREGGRSSIPETSMIKPIGRGVLDPRLRGDDSRVLDPYFGIIASGAERCSPFIPEPRQTEMKAAAAHPP